MSKHKDLLKLMNQDWNDRTMVDHRFWMADKIETDEQMWESGERDLLLMLEGLDCSSAKNWRVLEYGCGVGRILKAASAQFRIVEGVDVSDFAIEKAAEFLKLKSNVTVGVNNGLDLKQYETDSFDLVFSFSCLNHISIAVLPEILIELSRVVKMEGIAIFQLYVGPVPETIAEDTIIIRGYPEHALSESFSVLGLEVVNSRELKLPFDARDHERNLVPYIYTLKKFAPSQGSPDQLRKLLNSKGENQAPPDWKGSRFEYQLAATLLRRQAAKGEIEQMIKTLEHALAKYADPDPGTDELLEKLRGMLEKERAPE